MDEQNKYKVKECCKCKEMFKYTSEETHWDYRGFTPTKLVTCPLCGCTQATAYEEQKNPNTDIRFFSYKRLSQG